MDSAARMSTSSRPFDDPGCVYELKWDGIRPPARRCFALLVIGSLGLPIARLTADLDFSPDQVPLDFAGIRRHVLSSIERPDDFERDPAILDHAVTDADRHVASNFELDPISGASGIRSCSGTAIQSTCPRPASARVRSFPLWRRPPNSRCRSGRHRRRLEYLRPFPRRSMRTLRRLRYVSLPHPSAPVSIEFDRHDCIHRRIALQRSTTRAECRRSGVLIRRGTNVPLAPPCPSTSTRISCAIWCSACECYVLASAR